MNKTEDVSKQFQTGHHKEGNGSVGVVCMFKADVWLRSRWYCEYHQGDEKDMNPPFERFEGSNLSFLGWMDGLMCGIWDLDGDFVGSAW